MDISAAEKIYRVAKILQHKAELAPDGATIMYSAGIENSGLRVEEEIMILNRLEAEGVIEVVDNYSSEWI
jgi:hypothetical protein